MPCNVSTQIRLSKHLEIIVHHMLETGHHYRDQVSKIISWGHWFSFANILLAIVIAARYIVIADWPETALGQAYSVISLLGHFSFIIFVFYLVFIFPISFLIPFPRTLRFITVIFATVGMSLLIIDTEIFSQYNLHINPIIFEILLSKPEHELSNDWQSFFIFVPFLYLFELIISSIFWHRLRPLSRFKMGPIIGIFFFCCFLTGHLLHMWADAAVYRPITAQKANYPLAYPMTARTFLAKYGWLDPEAFDKRISETVGEKESRLDYPKAPLALNPERNELNVLLLNVSTLRSDMLNSRVMPQMTALSKKAQVFKNHFSTSNNHQLGDFSLLYGLPAQYADDIDTSTTPPFMLEYFSQAGYNLGIFTTRNLTNSRESRTSFVNLPQGRSKLIDSTGSDRKTAQKAVKWIQQQDSAWFAYINLTSVEEMKKPRGYPDLFYPNIQDLNSQADNRQVALLNSYRNSANFIDNEIAKILNQVGSLEKTVIIFTSNHGTEFNDFGDHNWGYGSNYSTKQLQVPLFILWPEKPASITTKDTNHADIVPTLLNGLNAVSNTTSEYSSGIDLFSDEYKPWQLLGNKNNFVILEKDTISIFSYRGLFTPEGSHQVRERASYKLDKQSTIHQTKLNSILNDLNYFYKANQN